MALKFILFEWIFYEWNEHGMDYLDTHTNQWTKNINNFDTITSLVFIVVSFYSKNNNNSGDPSNWYGVVIADLKILTFCWEKFKCCGWTAKEFLLIVAIKLVNLSIGWVWHVSPGRVFRLLLFHCFSTVS